VVVSFIGRENQKKSPTGKSLTNYHPSPWVGLELTTDSLMILCLADKQ
jgi:hypothetical protein